MSTGLELKTRLANIMEDYKGYSMSAKLELVREVVRQEILEWMEEHNIEGTLAIGLEYTSPYLKFVRVYNSHFTTGHVGFGALNMYHVHTIRWEWVRKGVTQLVPRINHRAMTDPQYQGEDKFYSFIGYVLNITEEVDAAFRKAAK